MPRSNPLTYRPESLATSKTLPVRGLRYHLRSWGPRDAPLVLLLHGWMDNSASFQFLVDALMRQRIGAWRFVAPDWRGFGRSQWASDGVYAYPSYFADLDALLNVLSPRAPVSIVGHSLGANIGSWYAALRTHRVRSVVNIEGFGLRARSITETPAYMRAWLDDVARTPERRPYPTLDAIVERVRELTDYLDEARARFVASHWAERTRDGHFRLRADPSHRRIAPHMFRLDEARAMWRAIEAPLLWIEAKETKNLARHGISRRALAKRRSMIRRLTRAQIAQAGHMVHWERPDELAAVIGPFLRTHRAQCVTT